jgi:hypothetical protein
MRCLGIPNTAHFANVTQIEDALQRKLDLPSELILSKFLLAIFSVGETQVAEAYGKVAT